MATDEETSVPALAADSAALATRKERMNSVARRLRFHMDRLGWRQADLARHAGLERAVISHYITERSAPTELNLGKLAKALGVEKSDLVGSSAPKTLGTTDTPMFSMSPVVGVNPPLTRLLVNMAVRPEVGAEIIAKLAAEAAYLATHAPGH